MKKHHLLLAACVFVCFSCSKDEPDSERDLYPQISQKLQFKWYMRQSYYEEYRYDGSAKQENTTTYPGDVYFMDFSSELWSGVPGTYKVLDQMTGLSREDYNRGFSATSQWKVFALDSLQIGQNRVRISFISADSLAFSDAGTISSDKGWKRTWEFSK